MKKIFILTTVIFSFNYNLISQIYCDPNLIPNNCIEKGIVKDGVEQTAYGCIGTTNIKNKCIAWHRDADLLSSVGDWASTSQNGGCVDASSIPGFSTPYANQFLHAIGNEGFRVELTDKLKKNKYYQLRLTYAAYTSDPANDKDRLKMYLSPWNANWNHTPLRAKISDSHSFVYPHILNGGIWQPYVKTSILPKNNEQHYFIIQNVSPDSPFYTFLFDDFILMPECDDLPELKFQNTNFWLDFSSQPFTAAGTIYAGYDVGATTLDKGDVIVHDGANVVFIASEIHLDSDPTHTIGSFRVESGGEFYAYTSISPCGPDCPYPETDAMINNFEICDNNPVTLGIPPDPVNTYNYQWSMLSNCNGIDEPTALSYLSSSTVSNPDFTPPTGTGSIVYELTITNGCGNSMYEDVTVNYSNETPFDCSSYVTATIPTDPDHFYDLLAVDITAGPKTEEIIIQLFHDANLINEYTLTKGSDFCDTYTFTFPTYPEEDLFNCWDYSIVVKDRNMCCTTYNTQTLIWDRNQTYTVPALLPNTFCAGDCYYLPNLGGATHYEMTVNSTDPGGGLVFSGSGDLTETDQCLWDGSCNVPGCISDHVAPDSYYVAYITFTDCSGNTHDVPPSSASLMIWYADCGYKIINNAAQDSLNLSNFIISPNPSDGKFQIQFNTIPENYSIQIFNLLGTLVCEKGLNNDQFQQIDASILSAGLYYVRIQNGVQMFSQKLVIQK